MENLVASVSIIFLVVDLVEQSIDLLGTNQHNVGKYQHIFYWTVVLPLLFGSKCLVKRDGSLFTYFLIIWAIVLLAFIIYLFVDIAGFHLLR